MTIPLKENYMIRVHVKESSQIAKKTKNNKWNGFDVYIIKDSDDAIIALRQILDRRYNERENKLRNWG